MKTLLRFTLSAFTLALSAFTYGQCNYCYLPHDTSWKIAALTEGPGIRDKGTYPDYYNNDGSTKAIKLPFSYCFYGQSYDSLFINTNGLISFKKPVRHFTKDSLPYYTDSTFLAPFFADIDTWGGCKLSQGDRIFYKITPTWMAVKWNYVGFYSPQDNDEFNSFQVIITNGSDSTILPAGCNTSFCYDDMMWCSSDTSGGFNGFGGVPASIGINKGDNVHFAQFTKVTFPGYQYYGPFAQGNGLDWLEYRFFSFNTCADPNNIPPVLIKDDFVCDTFKLCDGDSVDLSAMFLPAQPGQTCTLTYTAPGLGGISVLNNSTVFGLATMDLRVKPTVADTGLHTLTVTATDNNSLKSKKKIMVVVKNCQVGMQEQTLAANFKVYPNPGKGHFIIETENFERMEARISDVLGREVALFTLNAMKTEIDLSSKTKGSYFLRLYKEKELIGTKKLMKQ